MLNNVGQFVSEQPSPLRRNGLVVAGPENNVRSYGERGSLHRLCRFRRQGVSMNPDVTKIVVKARLKQIAQ